MFLASHVLLALLRILLWLMTVGVKVADVAMEAPIPVMTDITQVRTEVCLNY